MRKDDIFNPDFRKPRNFLRKENIKKFIFVLIVLGIFVLGITQNIYANVIEIEIRTVKGNKVGLLNWNLEPLTELFLNYKIINKSPLNIKLIINPTEYENIIFECGYNNTVLRPNMSIYIWFKIINNNNQSINYGVKIRGERYGV